MASAEAPFPSLPALLKGFKEKDGGKAQLLEFMRGFIEGLSTFHGRDKGEEGVALQLGNVAIGQEREKMVSILAGSLEKEKDFELCSIIVEFLTIASCYDYWVRVFLGQRFLFDPSFDASLQRFVVGCPTYGLLRKHIAKQFGSTMFSSNMASTPDATGKIHSVLAANVEKFEGELEIVPCNIESDFTPSLLVLSQTLRISIDKMRFFSKEDLAAAKEELRTSIEGKPSKQALDEIKSELAVLRRVYGESQSQKEKLEGAVKALTEENRALKSETKALAGENTALRSEARTLASESAALKSGVKALGEENTALKSGMKALSDQSTALSAENKNIKSDLATLRREIKAIAAMQEDLEAMKRQLADARSHPVAPAHTGQPLSQPSPRSTPPTPDQPPTEVVLASCKVSRENLAQLEVGQTGRIGVLLRGANGSTVPFSVKDLSVVVKNYSQSVPVTVVLQEQTQTIIASFALTVAGPHQLKVTFQGNLLEEPYSFIVTGPPVSLPMPMEPFGCVTFGNQIFVSQPARKEVTVLNMATNQVVRQINRFNGGPLQSPRGLAVAPNGDLLVADAFGNRVLLFESNGASREIPGLVCPKMAIFLPGDRILVCDTDNNLVHLHASGDLSRLKTIGKMGTKPGEFLYPTAAAYDPVTQLIAIADIDNHRIQFFDLNLQLKSILGGEGSGLLMVQPNGVAFDMFGNLYVTELSHKVRVFSPTTKQLLRVLAVGPEVKGPRAITVSGDGKIIFTNHDLKKLVSM